MVVPLAAEAEMAIPDRAAAVAEAEGNLQMTVRIGEIVLLLPRESLPRSPHQELRVAVVHLETMMMEETMTQKMRIIPPLAQLRSSNSWAVEGQENPTRSR